MATTERNILMQKIDENKNIDILYPVTKIANVINDNGEDLETILNNKADKTYVNELITGALEASY